MEKRKNVVSLAAVHTHTHTHTHTRTSYVFYQYNQQNNQLKQKGDNILSKVLLIICCNCINTYRWGVSSYLFKACNSYKNLFEKEVQC